MDKNANYDPKRIYDSANAFFDAYKRCMEPRYLTQDSFEMPICPAIVNLGLSCELYLKAILQYYSMLATRAGHNLSDLFKCLPEHEKRKIEGNVATEGFAEKLKNVSDCFETWRYIYEVESAFLDLQFIYRFAEVLKAKTTLLLSNLG